VPPLPKIAIVGDGVAGRYLYRHFIRGGAEATLFGRSRSSGCGLRSCAWGTERKFLKLAAEADIDLNSVILDEFKEADINGVRVKANFLTINKPLFLHELVPEEEITLLPDPDHWGKVTMATEKYQYVIDATGVTRALLPPIRDDLLIPTSQYRLRVSTPLPNLPMVIRTGHQGYLWIFPLGDKEFHYGCGSLTENTVTLLNDYMDGSYTNLFFNVYGIDLYDHAHKIEQVCACSSKVRLTGPEYSQPFVWGKVWGVGEAIGCVSPVTGAGITSSMECASLLYNEIIQGGNSEGYTRSVLGYFAYLNRERGILDKVRMGTRPSVFDFYTLKKNAAHAGLRIGLRDTFRMALQMRKGYYGR
jgi:flavin-dependent dehydrogenase